MPELLVCLELSAAHECEVTMTPKAKTIVVNIMIGAVKKS